MKKVLFVLVMSFAIVFVNAQDSKTSPPKSKVEKVTSPSRVPVKPADILPAIKASVAKDYAGYNLEKTYKIETKGVITYEVHVKKEASVLVLVYDKEGKFIKKEQPKRPTPKKATVKDANNIKTTEQPSK